MFKSKLPSYLFEEKAAEKHYVYGSGMPGCLYDYGPNFCETEEQAIEGLRWFFDQGDEVTEEMIENMTDDLREQGIHYFPKDVRQIVGASYCQVSEQDGPMPDSDED